VHIPTLGFLSDCFKITYLCDVSEDALSHCAQKISSRPATTISADELCSSSEVDVVFVVSSDVYHVHHAVLALQHGKHVFIEKPMALNFRDADAVIRAEKLSTGKVMVGYMRRYAAGFIDALKEIGGLDQIKYARVRGIIFLNLTDERYNRTQSWVCKPVWHISQEIHRFQEDRFRRP